MPTTNSGMCDAKLGYQTMLFSAALLSWRTKTGHWTVSADSVHWHLFAGLGRNCRPRNAAPGWSLVRFAECRLGHGLLQICALRSPNILKLQPRSRMECLIRRAELISFKGSVHPRLYKVFATCSRPTRIHGCQVIHVHWTYTTADSDKLDDPCRSRCISYDPHAHISTGKQMRIRGLARSSSASGSKTQWANGFIEVEAAVWTEFRS